jgi:hypothetical protein
MIRTILLGAVLAVAFADSAGAAGIGFTRVARGIPALAPSDSGVAVVRRGPGRLAQVVVVGYDGAARAVTPPLNGIEQLDLDGGRLAFSAGRCVFAGPLPAQPVTAAPRDPCFTAPAELSFGRLDRIGQRGGSRLRVPLTCTVPPRNHCTADLRLHGPGFTVRRRTTIPPGRHIVKLRIPAAHRRAAWRKGMSLTTIEHGRGTAGAAIPN